MEGSHLILMFVCYPNSYIFFLFVSFVCLKILPGASQVAGLAVVSVISFTSSASVAISTHIPVSSCIRLLLDFLFPYILVLTISVLQLFYDRDQQQTSAVRTSLLLVLYYFVGTLIRDLVVLLNRVILRVF